MRSENRSRRPRVHAGRSPKVGSHDDRTKSCEVKWLGLKRGLSSPLKMTLMQKSRSRRWRGDEMSPVVLEGVRMNFPPSPRRALASTGVLLWGVRSWKAKFDGSGRVHWFILVESKSLIALWKGDMDGSMSMPCDVLKV